jgi:tRNA pseudouridine38-40 synthase
VNIRLLIEYDGSDFSGWQRQLTGPSIQAEIEDILARTLGRRTVVYGASRTDSGVHARGQVATFFTDSPIEPARWAPLLNYHLPRTIRVLSAEQVPQAFNPQKDALEKEYEYVVLNRSQASSLDRRVYFVPKKLNWGRIREAMPQLQGTHDFAAFQGAKAERRTTVRTVTDCLLFERGDGFYAFRFRGNGFLKQMVRTMAGTLVEIGAGKRDIGDIERILRSRDRKQAGHTAPPAGLTLVRIYYPGE